LQPKLAVQFLVKPLRPRSGPQSSAGLSGLPLLVQQQVLLAALSVYAV
jgi:hypothetical protein